MKEKIGMEKLVMLLDIYEEEVVGVHSVGEHITEKDEAWIISKKFGFIQWLVENDKIDIVKVYENLTNYEIEIRIRAVKELLENNEEDTIAYLKLLMLLAIQDEPVKYLCEILR